MPLGLSQRPFQLLHFPLLTEPFRFRRIQSVQFLLAVAVLQLLVRLFFLADAAHGSKGILVPETSGHLIHLVSGFLRLRFGKLRIDAVGGYRLFRFTAAPEGLHHKIHQGAQWDEHHQRKDVLGLFEVNFHHGLSLFFSDWTMCSSCW